jgi:hypothetical protein
LIFLPLRRIAQLSVKRPDDRARAGSDGENRGIDQPDAPCMQVS